MDAVSTILSTKFCHETLNKFKKPRDNSHFLQVIDKSLNINELTRNQWVFQGSFRGLKDKFLRKIRFFLKKTLHLNPRTGIKRHSQSKAVFGTKMPNTKKSKKN